MMRQRSIQSRLLFAALGFFGLAGVARIVLEIAVRHELAQGPGDLGVAVLGMLFGLPMLLCLGAGAICTLAGGIVFLHHRLTSKKSA
jgi:hypothetical protein